MRFGFVVDVSRFGAFESDAITPRFRFILVIWSIICASLSCKQHKILVSHALRMLVAEMVSAECTDGEGRCCCCVGEK